MSEGPSLASNASRTPLLKAPTPLGARVRLPSPLHKCRTDSCHSGAASSSAPRRMTRANFAFLDIARPPDLDPSLTHRLTVNKDGRRNGRTSPSPRSTPYEKRPRDRPGEGRCGAHGVDTEVIGRFGRNTSAKYSADSATSWADDDRVHVEKRFREETYLRRHLHRLSYDVHLERRGQRSRRV